MNESLKEPWFGLTWAHKIKDNIGIGISNYLMIRSHSSNLLLNAQALRSDEMISINELARVITKIAGKTISGPNVETLVFPRSAGDIVLKAQAVLDYSDFESFQNVRVLVYH